MNKKILMVVCKAAKSEFDESKMEQFTQKARALDGGIVVGVFLLNKYGSLTAKLKAKILMLIQQHDIDIVLVDSVKDISPSYCEKEINDFVIAVNEFKADVVTLMGDIEVTADANPLVEGVHSICYLQ